MAAEKDTENVCAKRISLDGRVLDEFNEDNGSLRLEVRRKQSSLGDYKLRDLNDDINKLIREKNHWEDHIKKLGGPDFKAEAPKLLEREGKEVPGNRGYRYYGAARDLPGVRELFEEDPQPLPRKSRGELMKMVDVTYYGNCDEDDGIIVPQEAMYEPEAIAKKIAEWKARRENLHLRTDEAHRDLDVEDQEELDEDNADARNIYTAGDNPADIELMRLYEVIEDDGRTGLHGPPTSKQLAALTNDGDSAHEDDDEEDTFSTNLKMGPLNKTMSSLGTMRRAFVAHVPIYTQEQVEASLLSRRKREILEKYMSSDLLASVTETGELLGMESGDHTTDFATEGNAEEIDVEEDEEEEEVEEQGKAS